MAVEVMDARRRAPRGLWDGEPVRVARVDPADGARGVFRDACVMAQLSGPADPATLSATTFRIEDAAGVVPARLHLSPDRAVLVWQAERLLVPHVEHVVRAEGLKDWLGRAIVAHLSRFVPCDLLSSDWPP